MKKLIAGLALAAAVLTAPAADAAMMKRHGMMHHHGMMMHHHGMMMHHHGMMRHKRMMRHM